MTYRKDNIDIVTKAFQKIQICAIGSGGDLDECVRPKGKLPYNYSCIQEFGWIDADNLSKLI